MRSGGKHGVIFGVLAVVAWSTTGPLTYSVSRQLGVWQILPIICSIGALCQIGLYMAKGRRLKDVLLPPPLLWLPMLGGFVVTEIAYVAALSSAGKHVVGVNLVNYLWPTLTVVFAAWLVPGVRFTPRLLIAIALALCGLAAANWREIVQWLSSTGGVPPFPYVCAATAALAWGAYSATLARWNDWAKKYTTAPSSFLVAGAISLVICVATGQWRPVPLEAWPLLLLCGVGPQAAGYMCWELALHRMSPSALGLMASAIPLTSTLILLAMQAFGAGSSSLGLATYLRLAIAGLLIAAAIAVNSIGQNKRVEE